MQRAVVGTAGHIDHGKTTLVKALTGIDCDRWAEEKARGITIDLGFAHWSDGELQLGFIDVPGHERFLHNALAGLGGIRVLLLVVAADEGVKPQTREHLAIASLLGIPTALVALSKCDLVEPDLLELAALEVEEELAATPFAGAEIIPVSSLTGEGLDELKARLLSLAREQALPPDAERPARLPIDRAFHLKGLGLVVTGTLVSGSLSPGSELEVLPQATSHKSPQRGRARVRDVQVHGQPREAAWAGERTSLRLAGVEIEEVARGSELATPGAFGSARLLLGRFTLLPAAPAPLAGFTSVRVHLYTSEVMGRLRPLAPAVLEPGQSGLVEVRLAAPVVAVRGDRFIVRRPSPPATLGGGVVLDPAWHRYRGKALEPALDALDGERQAVLLFWAHEAAEPGLTAEDVARRLGERPERLALELEALTTAGRLLATPTQPRRWLAPAVYKRVAERAEALLVAHFKQDRLSPGLAKAEAVARLFPRRGGELAEVYLGWLAAQKKLVVDGGRLTLPGRGGKLTDEESQLAAAVLAAFERAGLAAPSPNDVRDELKAKPQIFDGVLRYLTDRGKITKLPGGLLIASQALAALRATLVELGWERFGVAQFKDHFQLSRKWAIPLLEHLDSVGATRRLGDERMVVR